MPGRRRAILFARHVVAEPRKALALTTDNAEQGSSKPRPGRSRATRAAGLTVVLTLLVLGLSGCTDNTFTRLGFPPAITRQGETVLTLWQGSWIAAFAVCALIWGLVLWAVIFHRKRGDRLPPQARYNMPIEITYTAIPFVLIAALFSFTATDEDYIDKLPSKPAVTVKVLGFQWSWQFRYPQYGVTNVGNMQGEGPLPVLEVPKGGTVPFNLTSQDVVHAF